MEYYEFRAMNTDILLAAEGDKESIAKGFIQARSLIEERENRFTRFSDRSELMRLNQFSGSWFYASGELYDIVQQSRDFFDQTDGLFDPSILEALQFAGYDKSMDLIRKHGADLPTRAKPNSFDFRDVLLDASTHAILLPQGMRIDLSGIAKGWIIERAANVLSTFSTACAVNAGGDIFSIGTPSGDSQWRIALEDPHDTNNTLAILCVGSGAVATSSIVRRRWKQGGRIQHHLIDPRTGAPAVTDWLSVTAVATHATTAEVFAKALLIAGSRKAESIAAHRSDIAYIAVDSHGKLWGPSESKEFLEISKEYA